MRKCETNRSYFFGWLMYVNSIFLFRWNLFFSDKVVSAPISDSSIPPCLTASTSVMSQNGAPISATGVGVHSLYSPTVDLRPCCAHIVSSGANCISSTAANPLDGGVQQRLPPHTSPFPPSPPAHPINGHRRSSSNTSSIAVRHFISGLTVYKLYIKFYPDCTRRQP